MLDGCDTGNRNDLLIVASEALIDGGMNAGSGMPMTLLQTINYP